jgi:hypothetical protein
MCAINMLKLHHPCVGTGANQGGTLTDPEMPFASARFADLRRHLLSARLHGNDITDELAREPPKRRRLQNRSAFVAALAGRGAHH